MAERSEPRVLSLDPRTKMAVMLTLSVFLLGGASPEPVVQHGMALIVLVLMLSQRNWRRVVAYALAYLLACVTLFALVPVLDGAPYFFALMFGGIAARLVPSAFAAAYLTSTTRVSEFCAAMRRVHVTDKIVIPLSVMFRMFPTIADERRSISAAMRMRGVALGGGRPSRIVEYRLVPLLVCTARIGEELSAAALTRGLGGEAKRTNVCQIGFGAFDAAVLLMCATPYVLTAAELLGALK